VSSQRHWPSFTPLIVALLALPALGAEPGAVAYRGARLETIGPAGTIERGVLVARDGKIEAIGEEGKVEVPDDARVVDLAGMTVLPGLVEPYFDLPIGSAATDGGRTVVIGGRTVIVGSGGPTRAPSFTKIAEVFDPYSIDFKAFLRSGLTHLNLANRGGFGQAALLAIRPDERESQVIEPMGVLFLAVSNSPASLDLLRQGLRSAKPRGGSSGSAPAGGPGGTRGGRPGGGPPGGGDEDSPRPGGDRPGGGSTASPTLELWRDVVAGKGPLVVEAANAAAILYVLDAIKDEKDVRLVLIASGGDVYETLETLKDRKVSLVLRPELDTFPNSTNRTNIPRLVAEAGLEFAFTPTADRAILRDTQDTPLFPLAMLVRTGLPRSAALEAVTKVPARLIGQEKNLGTLEPGKSASFLVFEGDPLDPASRLRQVVIEGTTAYEN
jgi:hypothetical protein